MALTEIPGRRGPSGAARPPSGVRIAVVDRDGGFVAVLAKRVQAQGWELRSLEHPPSVDALVRMRLGAVVIDLALLGATARSYMEELRAGLPELGVIVCTGPSSVGQRVRGLRLGVDDWITKPCHPEEVVARLEAVVRRGVRVSSPAPGAPLVSGPLVVRPDLFQAFVDGRSLDLTRREFELLHLLVGTEGVVLERDEIYQRVWGYAMAHGDRSIDVFVRKLRRKLELASPGWCYIHTHFGVGYRFAAEGPEPGDTDAAPGVLPYSEAAGGARVEAARRAARTLRPGVGALS
ncbi:MAG: response regulator transcription factor [Solirubrobacteraceae bacterium]